MSVFDVTPRRIGGVEMFVAELSRSLRAAGWRSILVFSGPPSALVKEFLRDCDAEILVEPMISKSSLGGALALFSLLRKIQPDRVHLSFTLFLSPLAWACRLAGAREVYFTDQRSRAPGSTAKSTAFHKRMIGRFMASAYRRVFCVSDYVLDQNAREQYVSPAKLTTLYNSIDFRRTSDPQRGLAFRERFGIDPAKILVSQVSWLIPEKGLEYLIRAAALAIPQDPRLHFLIAGDGPSKSDYLQLCSQLGIADHVTLTGLLEDPMVEGIYAASDLVCQFSCWQEAFGWVIAEAMAHGKPVIGTRVGGIPELIDDGVTGYLVPPASPADGARRILELSSNPDLRLAFGSAGFTRAKKLFDLQGHIPCLLSAYEILPSQRLSASSCFDDAGNDSMRID